MKEYNTPLWSFTRTIEDGTTDIQAFEATTWTLALQEFVNFLKGCGYILEDDSIQIRQDHEDFDWLGYYCTPVEDDWAHHDDFCPPFEGNPEECAFNRVTQDMAERALDEIVQRLINKNKGE